MKQAIALLLTLMMCMAFAACGDNESAAAPESNATAESTGPDLSMYEDSPEWVAGLEDAQNAMQLVIVAATGGADAEVSMHQKDGDGNWKQILSTSGLIGQYGLGKEREGDRKTPVGTYRFNRAFGILEDPGCALDYYKVTEDDYWSGDQREGYHYNEMVSIKDYPDLDTGNSEHLITYDPQYDYCLNISWNEECVPGDGSAIFLHCLRPGQQYTLGCIAIDEADMKTIMQKVQPDCVVVIDSMDNFNTKATEESD